MNAVIKTPKLTKRRLSLGKKSSKKPLVYQQVFFSHSVNLGFCITFFNLQRQEIHEPESAVCHVESLATIELSEIEPKLSNESLVSKDEKNNDNYEAVHEHYEELKCQVKSLEVRRGKL